MHYINKCSPVLKNGSKSESLFSSPLAYCLSLSLPCCLCLPASSSSSPSSALPCHAFLILAIISPCSHHPPSLSLSLSLNLWKPMLTYISSQEFAFTTYSPVDLQWPFWGSTLLKTPLNVPRDPSIPLPFQYGRTMSADWPKAMTMRSWSTICPSLSPGLLWCVLCRYISYGF